MHRKFKPLLVALPLLCTMVDCRAESCEVLKGQIEAKIRAGGVSQFSLTIVDAAAPASGRTVGTCGLGKQRIVYSVAANEQAAPAPTPGSAARVPARPRNDVIITECKDGSSRPDCGRKAP